MSAPTRKFKLDHELKGKIATQDAKSLPADVETACAATIQPSPRPPEFDRLRGAWRAARVSPDAIPPYHDLMLFGHDRLAGGGALISLSPGGFDILMAGSRLEAAIAAASGRVRVDHRSSGLVKEIEAAARRAISESIPVESAAHAVHGGVVYGYDLLALPLSNRWGPPLCQIYVQERDRKFALADTILSAAEAGVAALAVIRDRKGKASDFEIVAINDTGARLMRRETAGLRGRKLSEFSIEPGWSVAIDALLRLVEAGGSARFEFEADARGQARLGVSASATGDLVAVTLTDISDLKAHEDSFRLLFHGSPTPTALCDPDSLGFLVVNDAAAALWGFSTAELLAMTALDITPQEDWDEVRAFAKRAAAGAGSQRIGRHVRADRSTINVVVHSRTIIFRNRPAHLVTIVDVTEKQRAEVRLAHLEHHDPLTDLPNRTLFRIRLDEALSRLGSDQGQLAIVYLDLDQFKAINDTLGHTVGDALLRAVADRLRACQRPGDTLARFGGDEFAFLCGGLSGPDEASKLASLIVDVVGRPYVIEGHLVEIATSIGLAMAPGDGRESDRLVKNADMALYRAKEEGRGVFRFFEPEMDARARERRQLEVDLRHALTAGEFELYYQPLVALQTGAITGFEALLRWRHPMRGMVPPTAFIGLAEETGLIVPLGEWVLRQACAEAAKWPSPLKVAVNLSSVQFKSGNLIHAVLTALGNSGLPASRLELEITESILLAESEANLATLHRMRSLGVSVSMDDFGTGYSSLSYLRAFPFDKIKIDRSFVSELGNGGGSMAIVRAVAGLGSSLGVSTTAEGVETSEQLAWLRAEGCTEMQGFYFSPPVPACKIAPMLKANETADPRFAPVLKH